ncbi:MAG: nucleotidyltransferase family protein [Sphingomonadaceae bacterium]|nr:nucleotidyltransferase family protein [Sphingomonadaceae bacterium]
MPFAETPLLNTLCAQVRGAMGLPVSVDTRSVDGDLVDFALYRHRVGPLLHKAVENSANGKTEAAHLERLAESYRHNGREVLRQKAVSEKLTRLMADHSIACHFLKGHQLGQQIYTDPIVRTSKDVDILIAPERAAETVEILQDAGFVWRDGPRNAKATRPRKDILRRIETFKDFTFRDPEHGVEIETHHRMFFIEPGDFSGDFARRRDLPRVPLVEDEHYLLYLILHGALVYWRRLKWVVDLSTIVRTVENETVLAALDLSGRYGCAAAVLSSLAFVEELFPGSLGENLGGVLRDRGSGRRHAELLEKYRHYCASSSEGNRRSPMRRPRFENPERLIFHGQINVVESYTRRIKAAVLARS